MTGNKEFSKRSGSIQVEKYANGKREGRLLYDSLCLPKIRRLEEEWMKIPV